MPRKSKRRSWTSSDVRTLKTMARKKTRAASIARSLSALRALRGKRRSVLGYRSTRVPDLANPGQARQFKPLQAAALFIRILRTKIGQSSAHGRFCVAPLS
jgi:hypothetical protein